LDFTFISQLAKDPDFSYYPGFRDQIILAVPISFPVNGRLRKAAMTCADIQANRHWNDDQPCVDLKDFGDTPFILLESKYNLRKRTDAFFEECSAVPNICMEITQIVTAFALAAAGIGATFVPDRAITKEHPELAFYKLSSPQTVRDMHIVINSKHYISKAANRFVDMFVSYYKAELEQL
jgi:DNA-binding transcriptional LysR family regulator